MTSRLKVRRTAVMIALFGCLIPCFGPAQDKIEDDRHRGTVDVGGEYQSLGSNLGSWEASYLRGVLVTNARDTWNAEITRRYEFGDQGMYVSTGDTHILGEDWYASLAAGTSAGGFFLPRYRMDAVLNRKWRRQRNLVTSLAYMHAKAKDVHSDDMIAVGGAYYWQHPWILEGAVRLNLSSPGPAPSESQFVAVTRGRDRKRLITVRVEFGHEAYQLVGPSTVLTQFPSQSISLTWRQWTSRRWGFNAVPQYYHSPAYGRGGFTLGVFRDF